MKFEMITSAVVIILSLSGLSGLFQPADAGPSVDHGIYAALLKQYVKAGRFDYRGFKTDEKKYAQGNLKSGLDNLTSPVEIKYLDYDWSLNGS